MLRTSIFIAAVLTACPCAPALAQANTAAEQGPPADAPTATPEQIAEGLRQALTPAGERALCKSTTGNEIVVCAEDPAKFRVPSSTDEGRNTNDGLPRAPDLFGIPGGGVVVARGCFFPPCPRAMPPLIDLKAIPEAPPGSDAARFKEGADADAAAHPEK